MLHYPWKKIYNYHSISGDLETPHQFKAKVKLHGTNAGISVTTINGIPTVGIQGRHTFIDHKSFGGQFYHLVQSIKEGLLLIQDNVKHDFVIYGELCGEGIQRKVACSNLGKHHFFIFSVKIIHDGAKNEHIYDPDIIKSMLEPILGPQIRVLPWETFNIDGKIISEVNPKIDIDIVNRVTIECDKIDPYILREFNVQGPGEGYVWYPMTSGVMFKSKGDTHRNIKTVRPAVNEIPDTSDLNEYLDLYLTTQRYEQGIKESKADGTMKTVALFAKWIIKDVFDESDDKKFIYGKLFSKEIYRRSIEWYKQHLNTQY